MRNAETIAALRETSEGKVSRTFVRTMRWPKVTCISNAGMTADCADDVPGLVLSHRDASKVFQDLGPALEVLLAGVTDENHHGEISTGLAVGNEFP
jgi:hypothetical protein